MKNRLTRQVPDETGELVTFMSMKATAEAVGVTHATITRWRDSGLLRSLGYLKNECFVSVADAAFLRILSPKKAFELGIIKTPAAERVYRKEMYDRMQAATRPASHNYEEWESYDICYVIDAVLRGDAVKAIALHLGRTYAAVNNEVRRLRIDGDLPPIERDQSWRWKVRTLLTDAERRRLEEVTA